MNFARPFPARSLLISLLATSVIAAPLAYWAMPHLLRRHFLRELRSSDPARRASGMNYVLRHAGEDDRVLSGALSALSWANDDIFIEISSAVAQTGRWRRADVPLDAWLRWIALLGRDDDPQARILAVQQASELADDAHDPRLAEMLRERLGDTDAMVRYNALIATARLAGRTPLSRPYATMVFRATADSSATIARDAWLLTGLLRPTDAVAANWRDLPTKTAMAAAWAAARLGTLGPEEIDEQAAPLIYAAARWAVDSQSGESPPPLLSFDELTPLLAHPSAIVRDVACVLTLQQASPAGIEPLIETLLNDFNDDAKCSGAILAGLSGQQADLLERKLRDEDVWRVVQIQRLGLWMLGRHMPMAGEVEGLLTRDDLPVTTILLAMLHQRHPTALDYLLAPQADEPQFYLASQRISLKALLTSHYWWQVLRRFLPPPPQGPILWLDADDELRQMQVDVLRYWHLLGAPDQN